MRIHIIEMMGYIERLTSLGVAVDIDISMTLIMHSLPLSFLEFIMKYQMNQMDKSQGELLSMLIAAEYEMKLYPQKPSPSVMVIDKIDWKKGKIQRPKGPGKPKYKGKKKAGKKSKVVVKLIN